MDTELTTSPAPKGAEAAQRRDERQEQVRDWVVRCWGEGAVSVVERVERLFEEVAELTQAEGISRERLAEIIRLVYAKEPGEPGQEVGGIGTTLLAYCASKGLSADECERRELARILGKPPEHFRERHEAKVRSGLAQRLAPPASFRPDWHRSMFPDAPAPAPEQTVAVPPGFVLVPEEATGAMWAAGQEADAHTGDSYSAVWRAMVEAAAGTPRAEPAGAEEAALAAHNAYYDVFGDELWRAHPQGVRDGWKRAALAAGAAGSEAR